MSKIFAVSGLMVAAFCSLWAENTEKLPLILKPAFELTEKDQVLLDVLHNDCLLEHKEMLYITAVNDQYPQEIEASLDQYAAVMNQEEGLYQDKYVKAIQSAADHLASVFHTKKTQDSIVDPIVKTKK